MIDYVDAMLRTWGIAKRKIDYCHDRWLQKPDKTQDKTFASGLARSFTGRLTEGGHVGRGKDGSPAVEPLEVLRGDALTVAVAIKLALGAKILKERDYEHLYVHYVAKTTNGKRFRYFKMRHHDYYATLHNLHVRLESWIASVEKAQAKQSA